MDGWWNFFYFFQTNPLFYFFVPVQVAGFFSFIVYFIYLQVEENKTQVFYYYFVA